MLRWGKPWVINWNSVTMETDSQNITCSLWLSPPIWIKLDTNWPIRLIHILAWIIWANLTGHPVPIWENAVSLSLSLSLFPPLLQWCCFYSELCALTPSVQSGGNKFSSCSSWHQGSIHELIELIQIRDKVFWTSFLEYPPPNPPGDDSLTSQPWSSESHTQLLILHLNEVFAQDLWD